MKKIPSISLRKTFSPSLKARYESKQLSSFSKKSHQSNHTPTKSLINSYLQTYTSQKVNTPSRIYSMSGFNDLSLCHNPQCPNQALVNDLQITINELSKENNKMKRINEYFLKTLSIKNDMISSIVNSVPTGNTNDISSPTKVNLFDVIQSAIEKQDKKSKRNNPNNLSTTFSQQSMRLTKKTDEELLQPIPFPKKQFDYFKFLSKPKAKNANEHYDYVQQLVKQKKVLLHQFDPTSSLLAIDSDTLKNLIKRPSFIQIKNITKVKSNFFPSLQSFSMNKLENLCEYLNKMVYDYEQSINLLIRMKAYMNISLHLLNNQSLNETIYYLIENSCILLNCKRTNIYLYDPLHDALVINPGKGVKITQKNYSVNTDIIGYTFTHGEKQNIHDVTSDQRFIKDNYNEIGFNVQTMLCYPLVDKDNKTIGVIQALNKREDSSPLFNLDDEEILSSYSKQCSDIIQRVTGNDETNQLLYQLKCLINYSIEMNRCTHILRFISISEKTLGELGGVRKSQIVLINETHQNNNDFFIQYDHKNQRNYKQYTGLLRKCYELKQIVITPSSFEDKSYDNTVDIECCFSIISFPIYNSIKGDLIGIAQVGTTAIFSKVAQNSLKKNDADVYSTFARIAGNCYTDKGLNRNV